MFSPVGPDFICIVLILFVLGRTCMGLVIQIPAGGFGPVGGKDTQSNVPAKTETEKNSSTHLFYFKDKPEKASVIFIFHGQS